MEKAAAWQSAVTGPLRAVRRSLKGGVAPVAAADSGALRDAVKGLELESERLLQQALWQAVTFPPPTGKEDVPTLALGNLERYAGLTGNADAADDLRRIAEAVSAVSAA
jgi:hypothetical protein